MEYNNRISVIMSVYNTNENYLRESIESILNQSYTNFEFLIFDDASTDTNVKRIILEYQNIDSRIELFCNESNLGLTKTLNKGILFAKGEFIARIDSDDYSLPTRFQEQINYLQKNKNISAVGTAYYILKNGNLKKHKKICYESQMISASLFFDNSYIQHSSIMFRTEFLRKNNIFYNENMRKSQDFDLWVRISRKGNLSIIKKYLSVYRVGDHQISVKSKSEQKQFRDEICINQLLELDINASETERQLHLVLCDASQNFNFIQLRNWIKLLASKNREIGLFNRFVFEFLLYYRYTRMIIKKIIKNKEYGNLHLYLELFFTIVVIIKNKLLNISRIK